MGESSVDTTYKKNSFAITITGLLDIPRLQGRVSDRTSSNSRGKIGTGPFKKKLDAI
jgi:hypothetical protein